MFSLDPVPGPIDDLNFAIVGAVIAEKKEDMQNKKGGAKRQEELEVIVPLERLKKRTVFHRVRSETVMGETPEAINLLEQ